MPRERRVSLPAERHPLPHGSLMRHPNVTLLIGVSFSPDTFMLVEELVERGSLWDVLRDQRVHLGWPQRRGMVRARASVHVCFCMLVSVAREQRVVYPRADA